MDAIAFGERWSEITLRMLTDTSTVSQMFYPFKAV